MWRGKNRILLGTKGAIPHENCGNNNILNSPSIIYKFWEHLREPSGNITSHGCFVGLLCVTFNLLLYLRLSYAILPPLGRLLLRWSKCRSSSEKAVLSSSSKTTNSSPFHILPGLVQAICHVMCKKCLLRYAFSVM
jgi:hypothetical protein